MRRLLLLTCLPAMLLAFAGPRRVSARQPQPQPQQRPTFQSRLDVVAVDVHAVDGSGRPVSDLRPDDFTITVDGKPRPIVAADYLSYPSAVTTAPAATPAQPHPLFSTNIVPLSPPGRWILLVVDEENILASEARHAADAAARFLGQTQPNDRVGLLVIPKSGTHIDPTTDRTVVKEALQHIVGHMVPVERGLGAQATEDEKALYARLKVTNARERMLNSVRALGSLLDGLAALPGPKTVVFISQELSVGSALDERADFNAEISRITSAAARAQTAFYVLHLEHAAVGADVEDELPDSPALSDKRAFGLETVASVTGGKRMMVSGRVEAAMDRIALEISGYYLLGFRAEEGDRDGKPHGIKVAVKRPGVELRARPMFAFADPAAGKADASATDVVNRLLRSGDAATDLPVSLTTYALPDPANQAAQVRLLVVAEIDQLNAQEAATTVGYVIRDANGRNAGGVVEQLALKASPADPGRRLQYLAAAVVPPGRYTIRVAAVDAALRAGSVEHPFEARLTTAGALALGDLVVFDQYPDPSGKPRPSVPATVSGSLSAFTEAYSPTALPPGLTVRLEVADTATAPARATGAVTPRAVQAGRVQLSGSAAVNELPAGDYIARIVVSSAGSVLGQVVRPVHVVAGPRPLQPATAERPPVASVVVSALDGRMRPVLDLRSGDLRVAIDGKPRSIRHVEYLGNGRSIVVLVDERSFDPVLTPLVRAVTTQLVDSFTPADRLAVVPIAGSSPAVVKLSTDLREPREAAAALTARGTTPLEGAMTLAEARQILRGHGNVIAEVAARLGLGPKGQQKVDERTEEERRADPTGAPLVPPELSSEAETLVREARRIAGDSLAAARQAVDLLRDVAAPRAVLLVTGAALIDPSESEAKTFARAAAEAAVPTFVVHVAASNARSTGAERGLEDWTAATGGAVVVARGKVADLARLQGALAAIYRITFESTDADLELRLHDLAVTTTRPDVSMGAAKNWRPQQGAAPAAAEPESGRPGGTEFGTPPVTGSNRALRAIWGPPDASLTAVMSRTASYVEAYAREFSSVVAEETYEQQLRGGEKRKLRSDYLLVKPPNDDAWVPFRDVFEVDGAPIRDREERLKKLFLETPATAATEAVRISEESARYNLGPVFRTVNVPTLPLMLLTTTAQRRFEFRKVGLETVEAVPVWRVDYREITRPTVIRTRDGGDVPATGSVWIDPISGRVLKTAMLSAFITTAGGGIRLESTVVYGHNAALGIWVPVRMNETYGVPRSAYTPRNWEETGGRDASTVVVATATYANFRRFQVTTDVKIK
ncbi:MAG: VWA domain-containing protein [Bacteroidales bacterium]